VDDCGNVIHPLMVDGQVHSGIAQGLAQALYEEVVYDAHSQLKSGAAKAAAARMVFRTGSAVTEIAPSP